MSRVETLRLAELWRGRLQPLAQGELRGTTPMTAGASVYEATGWLIEGVFCGYFHPEDADVLWVRTRAMVEAAEVPEYPRFMPVVAQGVQKLLREKDPFAVKDQMTQEAQREFELQRIGGLTAWHVPLSDAQAQARFEQLTQSTWAILSAESAEEYNGADWAEAEARFEQHVSAMRSSWETYHLSAATAIA